MPMRLERWMRSKLSAITARTPRSKVPFAAQSRDDPDAVVRPGQDDERYAVGGVADGGLVDGHRLAAGLVAGPAALGAGRELVAEPDVGERAPDHDLVVARAAAP